MEKIVLDTAIKFGAGRYRQEQGLLEQCGEEVKRFGKKAYIVAGPRAFAAVKERLIPGFEKAGLEYVVEIYEAATRAQKSTEIRLWQRAVMRLSASAAARSWTLRRLLVSLQVSA